MIRIDRLTWTCIPTTASPPQILVRLIVTELVINAENAFAQSWRQDAGGYHSQGPNCFV